MNYKCFPPAKINLRLEVLDKREDGYHNIFSIIQPIGLCDELSISIIEGDDIHLYVRDRELPGFDKESTVRKDLHSKRRNLVCKAAELFLKTINIKRGISIELNKRIPIAAGLGGGSSDSASVLEALNKLTGEPLDINGLFSIGRRIGADVPFFLLKDSAIVQGIGDIVERIDIPEFWYIIVWPGTYLSTREVYKSINLGLTKNYVDINIKNLNNDLKDRVFLSRFLYNDLEQVSIKRYPQIKFIKDTLKRFGAVGSLMSGSGSSVFGLFMEESEAKKAYSKVKETFLGQGWALYLVKGL